MTSRAHDGEAVGDASPPTPRERPWGHDPAIARRAAIGNTAKNQLWMQGRRCTGRAGPVRRGRVGRKPQYSTCSTATTSGT
jgi:hypothetical protein